MSWAGTVKRTLAFESLRPVTKYGHETIDGTDFLYDTHEVRGGYNAAFELLPFRKEGYGMAVPSRWLFPDVFVMSYSGFALPAHDENLSGDAEQDDHLYYQGATRGVDLLTYGTSPENALRKMRLAIRNNPTVKAILSNRR